MPTRRNVIAFSGKAVAAAVAASVAVPLAATADLSRDDSDLYAYYRRYLASRDPKQLEWFYQQTAQTTHGWMLNLNGFWTQEMHRDWSTNGRDAKVHFDPRAAPAVLMDLEFWAGMRVWP